MHLTTVCFLHLLAVVFGVEDESPETLSVMVGDSVTLHTGIGEVRRNDHVVWTFGPDSPDILIAEVLKWSYMLSIEVRGPVLFRERLQVDPQTGSLTISNTGAQHSGQYQLTVTNKRNSSRKSFSVQVYAPLPVPVISNVSNSRAADRSSGRSCVLECSVANATWATLSLYRGSDLLSSISGGSGLSLPLELEDGDEHTYSCVVSNPFSNQTTLMNASELCYTPPGEAVVSESPLLLLLLLLLLIPIALIVVGAVLCVRRKHEEDRQHPDENC